MSDLNDDLLNYELGDDILLDQVFIGADEDELLLSDDDLEKDVSKEEKKQLKAEAEQWVKTKIQRNSQHTENVKQNINKTTNVVQTVCTTTTTTTTTPTNTATNAEVTEVTSTAGASFVAATDAAAAVSTDMHVGDDVTTSEKTKQSVMAENVKEQKHVANNALETQADVNTAATHVVVATTSDEVTSSSYKDQAAAISCSTSLATNAQQAASMQNAQEDFTKDATTASGGGDFSDPREDFEEERDETRTNIKTTNERDMETTARESSDKHVGGRFVHGKRMSNNQMARMHGGMRNMSSYGAQRPLLRFPPAHGNIPLIANPPIYAAASCVAAAAAASTLTHAHSSIIPGQFQINNPYVPTPQQAPSSGTQNVNTVQHATTTTPSAQTPTPTTPHQHEALLPGPRPMRYPYVGGGYRPPHPLPGPYRQPNPNGMFGHALHPHEYVPGPYGPNSYMPHGMGMHTPRGMYRGDLPPMVSGPPGAAPVMRPIMRLQRPPLQGLPPPTYAGGPPMQPPLAHRHSGLPPQATPPNTAQAQTAPLGLAAGVPAPTGGVNVPVAGAAMRLSKVLINPNFKGGVEAATSKFIKETQYMATIGAPPHVTSQLKNDEELLRQQEAFINKNRQHIEKRRQERFSPSSGSRRSLSRSRSRSRSRERERSYSPNAKRGGGTGSGNGYFERDRERDRDRDRERDRERLGRGNSRERDRPTTNSSSINRNSNRFRRAASRERDYENRSGGNNNYTKRRRSLSPNRGGLNANGRRGGDRERNDVEEDEETRAYRLEIEKQKALREKILRDKELKRRRAAEEKFHEEKRATQSHEERQQTQQQQQQSQQQTQQQSSQQQKLKPLIVTERKIITLKKRANDINEQQQLQPAIRKQLTSPKILPEGKRTLTGHLTGNKINTSSKNSTVMAAGEKKEVQQTANTSTAEITAQSAMEVRELATPSDDEVELDYDEDELMLEEEDRLLASPTPSPTNTRSPSPSPVSRSTTTKVSNSSSYNNNNNNNNIKSHKSSNRVMNNASGKSTALLFNASNRRVVLKSSSSASSTTTATTGSNRRLEHESVSTSATHGRNRGGNGGSSSSNHRDHIFDRLDGRDAGKRNKLGQQQQHQRVVIKHN